MYSLLQAPIDEMNPALLEMAAVLEVIICPYAPKIVKINFYVYILLFKPNDFKERHWIISIYYLIFFVTSLKSASSISQDY